MDKKVYPDKKRLNLRTKKREKQYGKRKDIDREYKYAESNKSLGID